MVSIKLSVAVFKLILVAGSSGLWPWLGWVFIWLLGKGSG